MKQKQPKLITQSGLKD